MALGHNHAVGWVCLHLHQRAGRLHPGWSDRVLGPQQRSLLGQHQNRQRRHERRRISRLQPYYVNYVASDGSARQWSYDTTTQSAGTPSVFSSVPSGSTSVGATAFLAPNNDLYWANTKIASGVTSAVGSVGFNRYYVNYVASDGSARQWSYDTTTQSAGTPSVFSSVPSGSTSVGATAFLAPNNDLYWANTKIASGVTSAVGSIGFNRYYVNYTNVPACS